jgi:hypothetical protein
MAFRRYGGMNFSAANNIIRNHYANSDNLTSSNRIGLSSDIITNGTPSNSNLVFESNIDMCGNSIFNASIANASIANASIMSLNLAGIYLLSNIFNLTFNFYPIYSSLTDYNQYYTNTNTLPSTSSITGGIYNNISVNIANIDNAYLISPNYGLKVFSLPNFSGDILLDVYNNTDTAVFVSPLVPLQGNSCQVSFGNIY